MLSTVLFLRGLRGNNSLRLEEEVLNTMCLSKMLRNNFEMTGGMNQFKKKIRTLTRLGGVTLNNRYHS